MARRALLCDLAQGSGMAKPIKLAASTRVRSRKSLDKPSRTEAEGAVRTLIRWAGDDPDREGLLETPARVARAYEEWF